MKKHIRFCSVLLVFALLCGALVGCQNTNDNPKPNTEETTKEIQENQEPFVISKKIADLKIWYEDGLDVVNSKNLQNMILKLVDIVEDKTGTTLEINSDKKYNAEQDADNPGILIGKTTFAESKAIGNIGYKQKDYYVGISGNKLIVYGETENACVSALTYLCQNVFMNREAKDGTLVFMPEDILDKRMTTYGIDHIYVGTKELGKFRIVVPEQATVNELYFASELRTYLANNYGYVLEIVNDSEEASGSEILVGDTNRVIGSAQRLTYEISEANGNVLFRATNMLDYEGLLNYIKNTFWKSGRMNNYTVEKGFSYTGTPQELSLNDGTILGQQSYGDIRCMFYNVYGWETACGPASVRKELQLEVIKAYRPDVMAFQEYTSLYSDFSGMLLDIGYAEVKISGVSPMTPLFYNALKLRIKDSGYWLYTGPNDVNSKSIVWAEFEVIATGKRFVCMSTHFMFNQAGLANPNAVRINNAQELVNLIADIQSSADRRNIPLVVGGDLNCGKTEDPNTVLLNAGLLHAWDHAAIKNNSVGYHGYSTYDEKLGSYTSWNTPAEGAPGLDHVYVSSSTKIKSFVTLTDKYSLVSSDHCPIVVEFSFN